MKTFSPQKLSLYLAQLLTILSIAYIIIFMWFNVSIWFYLLSSIIYFATVFLLLNFMLKRYINDKIDPLYKIIRETSTKEKKKQAELKSNKDIIGNARFEVEEWAKNQTKEIARLKEMERYRKEFDGNVSRELKTPIFNIQGYILTLLEGGIDDPKINQLYLKRTEKSIDRMISIVEDLESINKLESGEMKLNIESFNLVKMVEEVIDMEMLMANERKIQLEFEKPEKPVKVSADKKRIMEVLTNLVANAIKYGKRKGYVKISFYDLHDNIMVEVSDNGIGIEKEHLPRIFERFYRVDKSRSREQGGTGLGLSIVKHIIEAHQQTINVKSVLDEGTTFTFTLEKAK